jgi:hypothetical protein
VSEVEKTSIFWWGMIMFGLSVTILFTSVWIPYGIYHLYLGEARYGVSWELFTPWIFGSIVFSYIGWYMMNKGAEKKKVEKTQPLSK